ncbi:MULTISPECIES: hypothetical protein [unclassified Thioalkalivibrio]|uniref:hypothetical protein n=1 Tax=unclassified Thioalkalivibrio TaxID=2621013 RepID=UPI00036FE82F|nr:MULTISPECIES: hypothetical protein [unclassified Thioalkalivibrio]
MLHALPELPAQPAGPASFPHRTPQALRAWCAELPGSEPELGMQQLGKALEGLNQIALRPGVRASLVRILEDHLLPLFPVLERLLRQRPLPLGRRSRDRAEVLGSALRALLRAELLVVRERIDADDTRHAERLTAPLQAAVALLGALAVHHWRLYQNLPSGHWQQLYDLLRLARAQHIADHGPATDQRFGPLHTDRIETMSARLMVLGSTDPNALKMGEMDLLVRWINAIALTCTAAPDPDQHPDLPVLRCELERDHAPGLVLRDQPAGDLACFVELGPALAALRDAPENLEPVQTGNAQALAEHLLRLWSHLPTRRHSRERAGDLQQVCVMGLERIHDFLLAEMERRRDAGARELDTDENGEAGLKSVQQRDRGVSVFEMSPAALRGSDLALVDSPPAAGRDSDLRPLADDTPGPAATAWEDVGRGLEIAGHDEPTGPITKRHPPEHWQVDDIGAGGVRLCLDAPQQPLLIGDLVGLRAVDGHRWTVGVLRWIRFDDQVGERISIGVEFLANRCLPMQIQDFRNGVAAGVPQPGLFAPQRTDADGAALFLPAQVFDHEKRVVCWLNDRARVLELDSERTGTTLFTEVGCRMTALEVGSPTAESPGTEADPGLANDNGLSLTTRNRDDQAP